MAHHDGNVIAMIVGKRAVPSHQEVMSLEKDFQIVGVKGHELDGVVDPARCQERFGQEACLKVEKNSGFQIQNFDNMQNFISF